MSRTITDPSPCPLAINVPPGETEIQEQAPSSAYLSFLTVAPVTILRILKLPSSSPLINSLPLSPNLTHRT